MPPSPRTIRLECLRLRVAYGILRTYVSTSAPFSRPKNGGRIVCTVVASPEGGRGPPTWMLPIDRPWTLCSSPLGGNTSEVTGTMQRDMSLSCLGTRRKVCLHTIVFEAGYSTVGRMAGRDEGVVCPEEESHSGCAVQRESPFPGRLGKYQFEIALSVYS